MATAPTFLPPSGDPAPTPLTGAQVAADAVKEATRAYVAAAIALLARSDHPRQDDKGGALEWVRASSDCFRLQPTTRHWWARWILEHEDDLHALPQYTALLELLKADPQVTPLLDAQVGIGAGSRLIEARYIADHMVWTMGAQFGAEEGISKDFDAAYDEWDRELRATHIRQVWMAPLMGFSSSFPVVSLSEGLSVSRLSDEEISLLLSTGIHLTAAGAPLSLPLTHVGAAHGIRLVREHERVVGTGVSMNYAAAEWGEVNGLLEDVLVALRIFKAGRVGNHGFAGYFASWPMRGSTQFGGLADFSAPARQFGLGYDLTEEDCGTFPKFFDACQRAKRSRSLGLAMRRFAYTSDRSRAEDRIIDLMIAAEALFLADAEGELSYRLALRAAFFLDPELGPRSVTHRFLKNAYSVRSKIAHGTTPEPKILKAFDGTRCASIDDFATELERVIRIALRKAVGHTAREGCFLGGGALDALIIRDGA